MNGSGGMCVVRDCSYNRFMEALNVAGIWFQGRLDGCMSNSTQKYRSTEKMKICAPGIMLLSGVPAGVVCISECLERNRNI